MKIDTHLHTNYSRDCLVGIERLRKRCQRLGIIPCITDHNTIKGALAYRKRFGNKSCIVGEEITTKQGEILALYVKKQINEGLDFEDVIKELRRQKSIIILQHPFDRMRKGRLSYDFKKLRGKVDCIEIFNSRTFFMKDNRRAEKLYLENSKHFLATVGSDAHILHEYGKSYIEMKDFDITKRDEFLNALSDSKLIRRKSTVLVHAITKTVKMLKLNKVRR